MSVAALSEKKLAPPTGPHLHRLTVDQFERMVAAGFLTPDDRVELLEGWIVDKMTQNPPHAATIDIARVTLETVLPKGWRIREQKPIHTIDSLPEPDLAIIKAPAKRYRKQHPRSADIALVIEVADTTLLTDRDRKARIYARSRIPVYWIINLLEDQVEVYTDPKAGSAPAYRLRRDYQLGDAVPVVVAGKTLGRIAVRDLLP